MGDKNERQRRGEGTPPRRRVPAGGGTADSEFINLELDKEQTVQYREWRANSQEVLDLLDKEIESGYRFTFKYDDYNRGFACFMFPADDSDNSRYILTGRGGSAFRALAECLFKHWGVLGGEWSRAYDRPRGGADPDW
jgi:hypothetical protein